MTKYLLFCWLTHNCGLVQIASLRNCSLCCCILQYCRPSRGMVLTTFEVITSLADSRSICEQRTGRLGRTLTKH